MDNGDVLLMIAFPLETARERLKEAGFEVSIKKTLPPDSRESGNDCYRVVRQQFINKNTVELVVTTVPGEKGVR